MRARWLLFTAAAIAAAALAWWLFGSEGQRSDPDRAAVAPAAEGPSGLAAPPIARVAPVAPVVAPPEPVSPDIAPQPGESRIEGTVRRHEKPVTARVELRRVRSLGEFFMTPDEGLARLAIDEVRAAPLAVTDSTDDGQFAFRNVAKGAYLVRAVAADAAVGLAQASVRTADAREVADLTIGDAPAPLYGRVAHADGSAWRGDVMVVPASAVESEHPMIKHALGAAATDAEGRFVVAGLPVGEVIGIAVAGDGVHAMGRSVRIPSGEEYVIVWEEGRGPLQGRVLAAGDRMPIPGATVVATPRAGLAAGSSDRVVTGEDGHFRLLAPFKGGVLTVEAPGFADVERPIEDSNADLEILLTRMARIRGLVKRRTDGSPVAGAEITILNADSDGLRIKGIRTGTRVRTGTDGRFAAENLKPRNWLVVARGAGQASAAFSAGEPAARAAATVALGAGADVEVVLETLAAARVAGKVTDTNGAPVEGAQVHAQRRIAGGAGGSDDLPSEAYGADSAVSDSTGAFRFEALVPGIEYELVADAEGRASSPARHVVTTAGEGARVDLVLTAARWVDVTVVDAGNGAPIAGATVSAGSSESRTTAFGYTDAAGRLRAGPLGPGTTWVTAQAPTFARLVDGVEAVEGPTGPVVTIRLERGSRIAGRVLLPDGRPAAGATVELKTVISPREAEISTARSAKDGTFAFEELGEAERTVVATFDEGGLASERIPARKGDLDLTLRLGARAVLARVLDEDGNPVPRARASYTYAIPPNSTWRYGDVEDGRLVLNLPDEGVTTGTLTVTGAADANGARLPLGEARVDGVKPGQEVVVRLPRELTIDGRVLGPDGQGVAGARVRAGRIEDQRDQGDSLRRLMESPWTWERAEFVRTDNAGVFRVRHLSEGPHWVVVLPPPAFIPPESVQREAGATGVDFRLRAGASATITVLDPQGKPIVGAQVVAARQSSGGLLNLFSHWSGWSTQGSTATYGTVRLDGLDPATDYVLGVRGPTATTWIDVVKPAWRPADTTVRLAPGLSVSGSVLDAAGKPAEGVTVYCVDATAVPRTVTTDKAGAFRFTGLTAGPVSLNATSGFVSEERAGLRADATVEAGAEGVELLLK